MEFSEVLALRQSVRRYTDEAVTREELAQILEAADFAPVGKHNYSGYELAVLENPWLLESIKEEYRIKSGRSGDPFFGAPVVVLILGNEKTIDFLAEKDAGILAEHIHLRAADLGLGSVILYNVIHELGRNPDYAQQLHLRDDQYPLLAVAVGHTVPLRRRPHKNVLAVHFYQ